MTITRRQLATSWLQLNLSQIATKMRAVPTSTRRLLGLLVAAAACGCINASFILPPARNSTQPPAVDAAPHASVPGCSGELLVHQPPSPDSQPLTITAFFPFPDADTSDIRDGTTHLHYLLPAAVIAMEEINRVMNGYHLQLDVRNTRCNRFTAIKELLQSSEEFRASNTPHLAILGPGCLDVTQVLSPLARRLLLPQVSYANDTNIPVMGPGVSKGGPPDVFQMVRSVYHTTRTALQVMDYFAWTEQVAFVYDNDLVYRNTVEQLVRSSGEDFVLGDDGDIQIKVSRDVFTELFERQRIDDFMNTVRRKEIRVIAGLVGEDSACKLVCKGKDGTIPGDGFVWVFVGAYQEKWWLNKAACPCELNQSDVESVILVSSQVKNTLSNDEFELGSTLAELKFEYLKRLHRWCPETRNTTEPSTFFATTYDALLTLGLAISNSLDEPNVTLLDYRNPVLQQYIYNSLSSTNFTGASGRVSFSSSGERVGMDIVRQLQGGVLVLVGTFDSQANKLFIYEDNLSWPGDGGVPGLYPEDVQKTATLFILVFTLIITISSNIFTIVVMSFVIRHRNHRIFLASGQRLNYFIFAGAYMAFATVYIFVLFESSVGPKMPHGLFTFFCIVRLYMIMMGFTLTFGTLFVRAWRIYRIFSNPFMTKRNYTDTHLMLIVGGLALIDVVLVTVFIGVDSYGRSVSRSDADYDTFTVCSYIGCFSRNYFIIGTGLISAYKILQMLLFLFVVSLVRRGVIERKIYDDSKFLAIALYVTAIVFLIGLPLQVLLSVSFNIAAALTVNMTWINVSTDVTLFVIYIPKLYQIVYKKVDVRKLMTQKSKFYLYTLESRSTIL